MGRMTKVEKDHQDITSRLCSIKEATLPNGVTNKYAVPSTRQLMLQALGTQIPRFPIIYNQNQGHQTRDWQVNF